MRRRSARESGRQVECLYRVADKASALSTGSKIPKIRNRPISGRPYLDLVDSWHHARRGVVAQVEFESRAPRRFITFQFQALRSGRFELGFHRVNLHRPAAAMSSANCSSLKLDTPMARHSPEAGCPGTLMFFYIRGQHVTWRAHCFSPTSCTT
jgi:hypothetical protein